MRNRPGFTEAASLVVPGSGCYVEADADADEGVLASVDGGADEAAGADDDVLVGDADVDGEADVDGDGDRLGDAEAVGEWEARADADADALAG